MFFERADIFLLCVCIVSALFGTVMVFKAATGMAASGADMNPTKLVIVQLFSMVLGIIAFVVLTVLDADLLADQWRLLCVINVLLLVLRLCCWPCCCLCCWREPRRRLRTGT